MEQLVSIGIFFGGLGLLFCGFGLFWYVSVYERLNKKDQ